MKRIDGPGATPDNLFTDGNPAANIPATEITDVWCNDIQEEVCNFITGAGIALNGSSRTQMKAAAQAYLVSNSSVGRYFNKYDGGGNTFTLPISPPSALAVTLWVNGVVKIPTVDFTISGNILTTTANTPSGTQNVVALVEGAANEIVSQFNAGDIMPFAGTTAPSGWLLCAGQAVSRSTYAALFAAIGTSYGVGDGSATFNVPDSRGRVLIGLDNLGGTAANRVTGLNALGGSGGASAITPSGTVGQTSLTTDQIPAHPHPMFANVDNDPNNNVTTTSTVAYKATSSSARSDYTMATGGATAATLGKSGTAGGGLPHDHPLTINPVSVLQPYLGVGFKIKT